MKFFYVLFVLSLGLDLSVQQAQDGMDSRNCPKMFQKLTKGRCHCGRQRYAHWRPERNDTYVVNCTNTQFDNADMLEYIPNETEVLIFTGNNIGFLRNNIIGNYEDHLTLRVIDLSNNNLSEISGKAFHKVSEVRILILNHNNLRISGEESHPRVLTNFQQLEQLHLTNAFTEMIDSKYYLDDLQTWLIVAKAEGLESLSTLYLDQNEIWNISNNFFCSDVFPALTYLYLANNQLYDLDFNLTCIKKLKFLDVSYNKIKRLSKVTRDKIDRVFKQPHNSTDTDFRKINLIGNPYVCDCNLRDMFDWLQNTRANLQHREEMRCYKGVPEMNSGRRILNVQQLQCLDSNQHPVSPNHYHHQAHVSSGVTQTLLIILIILVLVLLMALLYIHKERVHRNVQPLIDNFQRSLQYRTIEKDLATTDQNLPEVNV